MNGSGPGTASDVPACCSAASGLEPLPDCGSQASQAAQRRLNSELHSPQMAQRRTLIPTPQGSSASTLTRLTHEGQVPDGDPMHPKASLDGVPVAPLAAARVAPS